MKMRHLLPGLFVLFLFVVAEAATQPPTGHFGFRATVEGEEFEARFADFEVVPRLGANRLPTGFSVAVTLAGTDSGNADRDAEMQLAEWFDSGVHPLATFEAREVAARPGGGFAASGALTIKGVSRPLTVPFDWRADARGLALRGAVELDRRWFGVGPEDDSSVAAPVTVFFDLMWHGDEI